MTKPHKTIPIVSQPSAAPRISYNCAKCPGYCCSYALIEVGKRDIARLARHFGVTYQQAEKRYVKFDRAEKVWSLRQQKDEHFGRICALFDTEKRRCTVYEARPGVCRQYPEASKCGYYEFLRFEREQQGDPEFIATTVSNP
jgi:Fe-S-cluster containining protein